MNTRKILFIIITVLIVVLIIFLFLIFSLKGSSPLNQQAQITPGATGTETNLKTQGLQIISSTPSNQAVNISTTTPISILFNNDIAQPSATISPVTQFTSSVSGRTLLIAPTSPLIPSTKYIITLSVNNQSFFLMFTTVGPTPTAGHSTRDPNQVNQDNQQLKAAYPDTYLSNYTPYSSTQVLITNDYVSGNPGHFRFTVTAKSPGVDTKTAFQNWAAGEGLNASQIASLDVVYK